MADMEARELMEEDAPQTWVAPTNKLQPGWNKKGKMKNCAMLEELQSSPVPLDTGVQSHQPLNTDSHWPLWAFDLALRLHP